MGNDNLKNEQQCAIHDVRQRFINQPNAMERVIYKVSVLQILALCISCGIGMSLTANKIYWQQIFIIPLHAMFMFIIIKLNKKWCKKVEAT